MATATSGRSAPVVWAAFVLALLALLSAWAFASPRFSGPDEPAHFLKAASVVRGQFRPPPDPEGGGQIVQVPERFAMAEHLVICFAFRSEATPDCAGEDFPGSDRTVAAATQAGSYPPLYYLLVGWPSLVSQDADVLYVMRLLSVVVNVVFLAAGTWALSTVVGRRLAMGVMLVVVTPMVAFLAAMVNPNGLEVSSAIAAWCAGLAVVSRLVSGERVGSRLAAVMAASGGVLVSTRWLGPLFLVVILAGVVASEPLRSLPGLLRRAARDRAVVVAGGVGLVVTLVSVLHTVWMGNLLLLPGAPVPEGDSAVEAVMGNQLAYVRAMIGWFGWLDVPTPTLTFWIWTGLVGLVLVLSVVLGAPSKLRVLAGIVVVSFLLPFSQVPSAAENGLPWQGRYALPVALGLVLVGSTVLADAIRAGTLRTSVRSMALLFAAGAATGHVAAFYWAERRYAVGLTAGETDIWRGAVWAPPGGNVILLCVAVAAVAAVVLVTWLPYGEDPAPVAESETMPSGSRTAEAVR